MLFTFVACSQSLLIACIYLSSIIQTLITAKNHITSKLGGSNNVSRAGHSSASDSRADTQDRPLLTTIISHSKNRSFDASSKKSPGRGKQVIKVVPSISDDSDSSLNSHENMPADGTVTGSGVAVGAVADEVAAMLNHPGSEFEDNNEERSTKQLMNRQNSSDK
jgi:hypothetical protein